MPRVGCLHYMAEVLVGSQSLDQLMQFVDRRWEGPTGEVTDEGEEDIAALANEMGWRCPRPIMLRPLSSRAALIHWRVLAFLYSSLEAHQRDEVHCLGTAQPPSTESRVPATGSRPQSVLHRPAQKLQRCHFTMQRS